jgi:hypothetical protein
MERVSSKVSHAGPAILYDGIRPYDLTLSNGMVGIRGRT